MCLLFCFVIFGYYVMLCVKKTNKQIVDNKKRKHSSTLLFCGSACFSTGQLMFSLATVRVTISNSSSYWGDRGGESSSTPSMSTSSEEDRRSVEPSPRGKKLQSGLPIPESGRWIWWVRKKKGTRPSPFPPPDPSVIPTNAAVAPSRWKQGRHREERW